MAEPAPGMCPWSTLGRKYPSRHELVYVERGGLSLGFHEGGDGSLKQHKCSVLNGLQKVPCTIPSEPPAPCDLMWAVWVVPRKRRLAGVKEFA